MNSPIKNGVVTLIPQILFGYNGAGSGVSSDVDAEGKVCRSLNVRNGILLNMSIVYY